MLRRAGWSILQSRLPGAGGSSVTISIPQPPGTPRPERLTSGAECPSSVPAPCSARPRPCVGCGRPAAARPLLREALAVFDALGARPWAARAASELAATGARSAPKPKVRPRFDLLAPQEFQIARAVAEGLSNPEAAAALFVSRKTVEAHLTRVYRKLGVRSRTELARLFAVHCFGTAVKK